MVSVTVRDRERVAGERARVRGEMTFGYKETLYPKDVELKTLTVIDFTPKNVDAVPIGSVSSPEIVGNSAIIGWMGQVGSPWQTTFGTYLTGSRSAYFTIIGG